MVALEDAESHCRGRRGPHHCSKMLTSRCADQLAAEDGERHQAILRMQ
jgi:hypothetical protein